MPIYSHSRLGTFENCPLRYKFNYIDRIRREGKGVEAFLGSRFHETMEKLYGDLKFKTATIDELKNYYNELWKKEWSEDVLIVKKNRTQDDYKKLGLKAIEDYYKRHHPFEEGRMLGIEKRIMIDLDGTGKYKMQGYIDRLMETEDGHYEIHDYKTSNSLPEQRYLDEDRQLALYEIGVRAAWSDVKEVDLVWHFAMFDKEMRSRRTREQLEELKKNVMALIDVVEATTEFPPNETNLCSWCAYQDICPLFAHEVKTKPLPVNEYLKEDGVVLVNTFAALDLKKSNLKSQINKLDTEQEKIKEAVFAISEKDGVDRLFGSDKILTVKNEIKVNYPKGNDKNRPEFVWKMHEMGLWDTVADINWSTLRKIAKGGNWEKEIPQALQGYVTVEQYKKIMMSKKKDKDKDENEK